jgi:two-component sensor histidine kinase
MGEKERLSALWATGLLDSGSEERFDRMTRFAASTFRCRTALISLVDEDRQWFKSRVGLDAAETPRDVSFCSHAIQRADEVMVVSDARHDVRFDDNPLVTGEPFIRFYAGVPLVLKSGDAIGTLCIIDPEPRFDFGEREMRMLMDMGRSVVTEIEMAESERKVTELEVVNAELQHRMGNMYAHVNSIISLLDRTTGSHEAFITRLRDSISAMAQLQALFAANDYKTVELSELVETVTRPFLPTEVSDRLVFDPQPGLRLNPRAAFVMTLVVHELAMNASKYGGLAHDLGKVEALAWTDDIFHFEWNESFPGKTQLAPVKEGFGTTILKKVAPATFMGDATSELTSNSFHYLLKGKADHVLI